MTERYAHFPGTWMTKNKNGFNKYCLQTGEDVDDDPFLRKNASLNSCDNGIGLEAISEDSYLNEESS